jgi:hypothetical protein
MLPPVPVPPEEVFRLLVVMFPPVVEKVTVPPLPKVEALFSHPPVVSIAPVPPVIEMLMLPAVPAPPE